MSACLLGEPCRYDGAAAPCAAAIAFASEYAVIPLCPEQLGGLSTPRTPSERQKDGRVLNKLGEDVTAAYRVGAQAAVRIAQDHGCTMAILKSKSPSCGSRQIYDGTFSGVLVCGKGVAAEALEAAGIRILDETEIRL